MMHAQRHRNPQRSAMTAQRSAIEIRSADDAARGLKTKKVRLFEAHKRTRAMRLVGDKL